MGLGIVRLDADRLAACGDRLVELALVRSALPRLEWASAKSGLMPIAWRYAAIASSSLPWSCSALPRLEWASAKSGLMPIASAICGDRLVELALVPQRIAEVGVGLGKVGLDADRLAICGDRLVELAQVLQRIAEIGKIKWILSVLSYRLTDQFDRYVVAPHLIRNDAEQVERIRMLGLGRQHAPITSLGRGQSSGLVVFDTLP